MQIELLTIANAKAVRDHGLLLFSFLFLFFL